MEWAEVVAVEMGGQHLLDPVNDQRSWRRRPVNMWLTLLCP
jgi:hypothetical protein